MRTGWNECARETPFVAAAAAITPDTRRKVRRSTFSRERMSSSRRARNFVSLLWILAMGLVPSLVAEDASLEADHLALRQRVVLEGPALLRLRLLGREGALVVLRQPHVGRRD